MSDSSTSIHRAIIAAVGPAALTCALVAHPYLPGRLPNDEAVAAAVAADPTRWGAVHMAAGVASGLMILAFLALRACLREAGDHRFSAVGVPFVVIGSTLFAMLPAMEFAPLAAAGSGSDLAGIVAVQAAVGGWFVAVLTTGALTFAIGVAAFIRGITVTAILGKRLTAVVAGALAVMALARFVPLAAVQFYVQSAAALLAFLPLAHHMWRRATAPSAAGSTRFEPTR
jgi:hypothetical protein